ncbi:diadenosine tetraphosphate (Ap4A) HIT family hydrolase [Geothermobacter ehrlichii]|uniref:Diadenosine tetraphosphate (Ap4A) HIT family hydrolase n=2 Tax=Geothermobacter ehrlichii TaxID=213224 RepID=A0A5D3WK06_9BACT|nr:diadenosine tetraphosphate (Ap4A) HIT family hydrolase [Geothermobacter ehrlichii]
MCRRWLEEPELRIAELDVCCVMLNRDQFFPGYTLVFTREHVTELFHLDTETRHRLIDEVSRVAGALNTVFRPAKMNYELLGNMVPHIHWHLIPRFRDDALWPTPVWSRPHEEVLLSAQERRNRIAAIRGALQEER